MNFIQFHLLIFRVSISPDPTEKTAKKVNISTESKTIDIEEEIPTTPLPPHRESTVPPERTRLIVFGVAKIQKTRLLATLSGLKVKLELDCCFFNSSAKFNLKHSLFFSHSLSWKLKYPLCTAVQHGERKPDRSPWSVHIPANWVAQ